MTYELETLAKKGNFNEKESLVAEAILRLKMGFGATSRLCQIGRTTPQAQGTVFYQGINILKETLREIGTLNRKYATKLGISPQRYEEIKNFIYDNEKKI